MPANKVCIVDLTSTDNTFLMKKKAALGTIMLADLI
jgi:hypothetical protein